MNRHPLPVDGRISRAVKPACELLEGRLLMSADPVVAQNTATLRNHTLLVQGSDKADSIVMSLTTEGEFQVKINDLPPTQFAPSSIRVIRAYGLGGSDHITVDQTNGPISIPTYIFGGNGNDSLTSGLGADTLIGGKGDDLLQSGDGNDRVEGNAGNDRILAGDGRDTINPGPGADIVSTGAGKDRVIGADKGDQIDTGAAAGLNASKKTRFRTSPVENRRKRKPAAFNANVTGLTPTQVRSAYQFGDLSSSAFTNRGAGQTIAIVDAYHYPTAKADLNFFSDTFDLPRVNRSTFGVLYATGNQPDVDRGWSLEAALDLQWAHAIAPLAKILLVEADTNLQPDVYRAVSRAVDTLKKSGGGVISMSLGLSESVTDPDFTDVFRNASTGNITFVAASGDTGGDLSAPASDAEVLSVGGTTLTMNGNTKTDDTAWVNGGGGESTVFDRPDYQNGLVIDGATIGNLRVTPDVAYNAGTGVAVYTTTPTPSGDTGWISVGGTSAGAPQWAGLVALANEKRRANGLENLGGNALHNYIYGLARKDQTKYFDDINTGDNTLHPATDGFDLATGWGTPKATTLINELATADAPEPVSARVNIPFLWHGAFRRDLFQGLPAEAVVELDGRGTAKVTPTAADFIMDQGPTFDPVTGFPLPPPDNQVSISGDGLERIGNTVVGRGTMNVLLADGYLAGFLVKFDGRLVRSNGQDKIIGEFYAISRRGKILAQGPQAIFRGEFSSAGAAKP